MQNKKSYPYCAARESLPSQSLFPFTVVVVVIVAVIAAVIVIAVVAVVVQSRCVCWCHQRSRNSRNSRLDSTRLGSDRIAGFKPSNRQTVKGG